MQITNRTEYALRFLMYLAKNDMVTEKISTVSEKENIPKPFLAQIVNDLKKCGLVSAFRGPNGGVKLAKSVDSITILDVISSIEGPFAIYKCLETADYCQKSTACPLCGFWAHTQNELKKIFRNTTISDLLSKSPKYKDVQRTEEVIK